VDGPDGGKLNFSTLPEFEDSICMSQPVSAVAELIGPVARLLIAMYTDPDPPLGTQFRPSKVRTPADAVDAMASPAAADAQAKHGPTQRVARPVPSRIDICLPFP
jgi:hypothetical protein